MATLNDRQRTILTVLQEGTASIAYLSDRIGAPASSIRRNIQELRAQDHNIVVSRGEARLQATA